MASNDYDDLLESFLNNSSKAYDEDKKAQLEREGFEHQAKSSLNKSKNHSRNKRGRKLEKKINKKNQNSAPPEKQSAKAIVGKVLLGFVIVCAFVGIVVLSVAGIYGFTVVHGDPVFDLNEEKYSQNQTSFIYGTDSKGETIEITRLHGEENRIWVDMEDMSPYMKKAFIALEDKRFEKHHGVDWFRTMSAIVKYQAKQGGSTITQQLVKNLTDENQATFVRKFNEILAALNLEKNYDKNEIIEAYMNTIYLSHGCYGVKTAAEKYFGKEISELNAAECACLASITQFPDKYDPLNHPKENRDRQLFCLGKMLEEGYLTQAEYDEAVAYEMIFTNSENYKGSTVKEEKKKDEVINSYYTDFVIDEVLSDLKKMGYTERTAKKMLYGGGLRIYTAIDFDIQKSVENVYENYKKMPDKKAQSAMAIMGYDGRVYAVIGGTGKKKANRVFNRATQAKRQPGSTIKPLSVYSAGLEKTLNDSSVGIFWSTMISDSPIMKIDGKWWPKNENGSYSGNKMTLQKGLANSLNTISAQTLKMIGTDYSYNFLSERYHLSTLDPVDDNDFAPLATGALDNGATVLDMTAAFAAFGNGGYYYEPYAYYKIEDSQGNVIIEKKPENTKQSAISEDTAWVMNKLLQTVMTDGTGRFYKLSNVECFGKTGTTTASKDRWFIGGTPDYVAAVWYGYDTPKEVRYSLSPNPCGTLWNLVFKDIYSDKNDFKTEFEIGDGIVKKAYCTSTGKLATESCPKAYGWYDKDSMPEYCSGGHSAPETDSKNGENEEVTNSQNSDEAVTSSENEE